MKATIDVKEWVSMFREIGLDDAAMKKWHQIFERKYPESHQSFLEWLGVSPSEISRIRSENK